jgi:hypothetical protein
MLKANRVIEAGSKMRPKLSNDKIFQMRTSEAFMMLLDDWRRTQPTIPSRSEAVRILVEKAIRGDKALGRAANAGPIPAEDLGASNDK